MRTTVSVRMEPGTSALLLELLLPLYEHDLADVARTFERWFVEAAGQGVLLESVQTQAGICFRFTPFGELTMRELVSIATQAATPPHARRMAIGQAMCLAGYARPTS